MRLSELLGLTRAGADLRNTQAAAVTFEHQVRSSGSARVAQDRGVTPNGRTPPAARGPAARAQGRSPCSAPGAFVFCTRTGRALGQRNVLRELRRAMTAAVDGNGRPMFPVLHQHGPLPRGAVPNFHSFRHTAASEAIAVGDGTGRSPGSSATRTQTSRGASTYKRSRAPSGALAGGRGRWSLSVNRDAAVSLRRA
jgi:hypothetical protein